MKLRALFFLAVLPSSLFLSSVLAQAPVKIDRLTLGGDADAGGHKIENLDAQGSGLATTGQVAAVEAALAAAIAPRTVAEIVIPLGPPWVDFEVKVSENNFSASPPHRIWLHSMLDTFPNWNTSGDKMSDARIFWVPQTAGVAEPRQAQWIDIEHNTNIDTPFSVTTGGITNAAATPQEVVVQFTGVVLSPESGPTVPFNEHNEHLFQFIYTRHTAAATETNAFGGRRWHVAPVKWRRNKTELAE